ncbi:MAG: efflux RND transporter periplasmic adaptor subunit [Paludibacter sp.]|jgi:RND family efflux transporter MFP subunit|nr:efflux RND transporter periplasmic adaptor subunit [Paludibacter sp.]
MKKNRIIISLLGLALAMTACSKKEQSVVAEKESLVSVATAVKKIVPQTTEFSATVLPEAKNNIVAGTPGRIRKLFVEVGDHVSKDQKIAQMDDANVDNAKIQIANLKTNYNRLSELHAVGGVSQQDLENVKLQLDVAEKNFATLQENTYLVSPINGVITARYFDEGDLFAAGQYPLVTVMQIAPVKIKINIPEKYFLEVKKGMSVDVKIDVFGNEKFTGKVSLIYPVVDELTRSFTTEISIANSNWRIRPGMFARVTINFGDANSVVIPDKAIVKQQGTADRYAYVLNSDNSVSYKKIILGKRLANEYEVTEGISEGEKIVVEGLAGLLEGKTVTVANQ